jgi:hypothetical protein
MPWQAWAIQHRYLAAASNPAGPCHASPRAALVGCTALLPRTTAPRKGAYGQAASLGFQQRCRHSPLAVQSAQCAVPQSDPHTARAPTCARQLLGPYLSISSRLAMRLYWCSSCARALSSALRQAAGSLALESPGGSSKKRVVSSGGIGCRARTLRAPAGAPAVGSGVHERWPGSRRAGGSEGARRQQHPMAVPS